MVMSLILGGYTCLLAAGFVISTQFIVRPIVNRAHKYSSSLKDAADSSLFSALLFLMLLLLAFTAEVIGWFNDNQLVFFFPSNGFILLS